MGRRPKFRHRGVRRSQRTPLPSLLAHRGVATRPRAQGATAAVAVGMAILHGRAAAEVPGDTPEVDLVLAAAEALAVRVDLEAREALEAQVALEAQAEAALMAARGRTTVEDEAEVTVSLLQVEVRHHQVVTQAAEALVRPASGRRGLIGAGLIPRCWKSCDRSLTRRRSSSRTT